MVTVIFYEKPGCITNAKQKRVLEAAGHIVDARNLLTQTWTAFELQEFLEAYPIGEWFNTSAPVIKSGTIKPEQLSKEDAIELLRQNPLLIRRPLLRVGDRTAVGFNPAMIKGLFAVNLSAQNSTTTLPPFLPEELMQCAHTVVAP
ncbi:MAG: ArsC/Spx/MgsR family protein [Cyanobacteria bacterium P01_H01_bin.15]